MVVGKEFWEAITVVRRDHQLEPAEPPRLWNAWAVRKKRAGYTSLDVQVAHALYVRDQDFKRKGWPIAIFMSPRVCDPRLKRHPEPEAHP